MRIYTPATLSFLPVFVFSPSPPSSGSHAVRERYSHQRQYPRVVIISERQNGSLTYARHVRNLQAPFVDASRQRAAPIRMAPPLRMQPPHLHTRQSSRARVLGIVLPRAHAGVRACRTWRSPRDSSVIRNEIEPPPKKVCVCVHVCEAT